MKYKQETRSVFLNHLTLGGRRSNKKKHSQNASIEKLWDILQYPEYAEHALTELLLMICSQHHCFTFIKSNTNLDFICVLLLWYKKTPNAILHYITLSTCFIRCYSCFHVLLVQKSDRMHFGKFHLCIFSDCAK